MKHPRAARGSSKHRGLLSAPPWSVWPGCFGAQPFHPAFLCRLIVTGLGAAPAAPRTARRPCLQRTARCGLWQPRWQRELTAPCPCLTLPFKLSWVIGTEKSAPFFLPGLIRFLFEFQPSWDKSEVMFSCSGKALRKNNIKELSLYQNTGDKVIPK